MSSWPGFLQEEHSIVILHVGSKRIDRHLCDKLAL